MLQMRSSDVPLAIVGMGCRLPGADGIDQYWTMLRDGKTGLGPVPPHRFNRDFYYHPEKNQLGKSYTQLAGIVPERPLDPAICDLPDEVQAKYDPAHLIMCEVAAAAVRHAGYDPFRLPSRNVGVYIGHCSGSAQSGEIAAATYIEQALRYLEDHPQFHSLPAEARLQIVQRVAERFRRSKPVRRQDGEPDLNTNMAAVLINRSFGLQGPAMAADAACASSMVALNIGAQALRNGWIDMAIVGGASYSKWCVLVLFSQAQSVSATGSRPFDADADGMVSADGYTAIVMKTLPRALADGDKILAVIRGIGMSSDGKGKSLWAPRKEGQILAVQRAYNSYVDPKQLDYIECHATSTQVGDATELSALSMAMKDWRAGLPKLPIGGVKANVGHTLESAGLSGLIKTVLCMQNRTIPGQINFKTPNPEVPWDEIPFYVPTKPSEWQQHPSGRPRRAAVNAFGIGGLNVHVVMDDAPTAELKAAVSVPASLTDGSSARITPVDPESRAVAIVGRAVVLPGALNLAAFWDLLVSGRSAISHVDKDRWDPAIYLDPSQPRPYRTVSDQGGFITDFVYDWKKHKVPPKQIADANPLQFMLLEAADQCLKDSKIDLKALDRTRAAVLVGSVFGGDFGSYMQFDLHLPEVRHYLREELLSKGMPAADAEKFLDEYEKTILKKLPGLLDETGSFTPSTLASRLTKTFDFMGGAVAIDAGDTSSMAVVSAAMGMLLDRTSDVVLCCAGQRSMDLNVYEACSLRGALATEAPRPTFDVRSGKMVPGEGVAVVLLKRLSDATRDGDRIHGIIRGMGVSSSGDRVEDHGLAFRQAADRALAAAQADPATINAVEVARSGPTDMDVAELNVLTNLSRAEDRRVPLTLNSTGAQIGHLAGASGMVSLIKATLEMEHGRLAQAAGLDRPIPEVNAHGDVVRVAAETLPMHATLPDGKTLVDVTNGSARGVVYHLLLEGGNQLPAPPSRVLSRPTTRKSARTVRLGAASRESLMAEVHRWSTNAESLYANAGQAQFQSGDRYRVSIVAENSADFAKKARFAAERLFEPGSRAALEQLGVFGQDDLGRATKVAFLLPGQGSQYVGMLREVVEQVPAAAGLVAEIDAVLSAAGLPQFAEIAWSEGSPLGTDVGITQIAMLCADWLMCRLLESVNVHPDIVAGHSYGEFAALVVSGALTLADAVRLTLERTRSVERFEDTRGSLLSTTAPRAKIETLLREFGGAVYLATDNAPDQTVVGGSAAAIQAFQPVLAAAGFAGKVLAVPRPYHTPLLRPAQAPFGDALQRTTFQAPQVAFFSSVTAKAEVNPAQIRQNLVDQLVSPVRYVELVERLAAEGVTLLIEVGPGQVLTRLNQRILSNSAISMIATDVPKQSGIEQFQRVVTLAETAGAVRSLQLAGAGVRSTGSMPRVAEAISSSSTVAHGSSSTAGAVAGGHLSGRATVAAGIRFFDATARRLQGGAKAPSIITPASAPAVASAVVASPVAAAPAAVPVESPAAPQLDRARVQEFMINFVVDQTGYPAEMVDVHADLEADLGIDSIKKAQLIGELAEQFSLSHLASQLQNLSLDDFRTIDSILDFVTQPAGDATVSDDIVSESTAVVADVPAAAAVPESAADSAPAAGGSLNRAEVEQFMINFVVDQTGYPAEMVDVQADLEADLGIDSIKKAQLIGELAEHFSLSHLAGQLQSLSLDDFRTVDSILNFVTQPATGDVAATATPVSAESATAPATSTAVSASAVAVAETTSAGLDRAAVSAFMINFVVDQTGYPAEMVEADADLEADLGIDSIKKAQLIGELAEQFSLSHLAGQLQNLSLDDFRTINSILDFVTQPTSGGADSADVVAEPVVAPAAASVPAAASHPAPSTVGSTEGVAAVSLDRAVVQTFMINFVVDQTGYPAEMVEVDADLEADLGIDSIKKAQLIGELAEQFSLSHLASQLQNLSLDDFRTINSILDFVTQPSAAGGEPVAEVETPAAEPATETASNDAADASAAGLDRAVVQTFMINFVVDQTGYPPEMVEVDADLEADLGIDSIKKAQLIGELAEQFSLSHLASQLQNLSLDDFRTISSILDFVTQPAGGEDSSSADLNSTSPAVAVLSSTSAATATAAVAPMTVVSTAVEPATTSVVDASANPFAVVRCVGTPYEMGLIHGRHQAVEITTIMSRYAALLGPRLQNIPELNEALAKPTMYFGEAEVEELRGIADGCGVPFGAVLAHNLGMYPEYVPGCAQFASTARRNSQYGMIHAVNEDSPLALTLSDCLARIVQVRIPQGKLPHVTFSVSGQLGGLNGINSSGLGLTSTLLLDRPRRAETAVGYIHPVLVTRILEAAETIEDAIAILRELPRAGAWSFCLSEHKRDRLCYLEYDGGQLKIQEQPEVVLTTNHCLLQEPLASVPEHSQHRLTRLYQLLDAAQERLQWHRDLAQSTLRDRFDLGRGRVTNHPTMSTIRRVDNQISLVMFPAAEELWVTPGPRSGDQEDQFFRLRLKDLWANPTNGAATSHGTAGNAASYRGNGQHSGNGVASGYGSNGVAPAVQHRDYAVPATAPAPRPVSEVRAGLPADTERLMLRHVMRMSPALLPVDFAGRPEIRGRVLFVGQNPLADALRTQLETQGASVVTLAARTPESAIEELNQLWAAGPCPHLVLLTPREPAAAVDNGQVWLQRKARGLTMPFFVIQRWVQLLQESKQLDGASLIATLALGGDFGFGGRVSSLESGGLAGLLKGLRRELPGLLVKAIDAPLVDNPAELATAIIREWAFGGDSCEVGFVRGQRRVVEAIPEYASTQFVAGEQPFGTWVVTGGARGVTAVVARELGRRFGLRMHLLGSTALPQIDPSWRNLTAEGWASLKKSVMERARASGQNPAQTWKRVERDVEIDKSLQAFRDAGVTATYHACDVAQRDSVAAVLDAIRKQDGPIHGIIHGAGLEAACRFEKKKRESVDATIAVKIDGAFWLSDLTRQDPLRWFIGFGSTSGRFGGLGQTDYSLAQDMLCKFCDGLAQIRPNVIAKGFHWPAWGEVGMAARPESKLALQSSGISFMMPMEGVAHVVDEVVYSSRDGEVLFIDKPDGIDSDGTMGDARQSEAYRVRAERLRSMPIAKSIEQLAVGRQLVASAEFDPKRDPFLTQHVHDGVPILPGVIGLEFMAETSALLTNDARPVCGLRNLQIHNGFRFFTDRRQVGLVTAEITGNDSTHCRLNADFCDRAGRVVEPQRLQMDVDVIHGPQSALPRPTDLGAVPTQFEPVAYVEHWQQLTDDRIFHGRPLQSLREIAVVPGGAWGKSVVPAMTDLAGGRPTTGWQIPWAMIDGCLLTTLQYLVRQHDVVVLPLKISSIRWTRLLKDNEAVFTRVWERKHQDKITIVDCALIDAAGEVVVEMKGVELFGEKRRMVTPTATSTPATPATAPAAPVIAAAAPTAAALPTVSAAKIANSPMIDSARWESSQRMVATVVLHPVNDPFLVQHKFNKKPLLPAVVGLETMLEAAQLAVPGALQVARNFRIPGGVKFHDDNPQTVQVIVEVEGSIAHCKLTGAGDRQSAIYQSVDVEFGPQATPIVAPKIEEPPFPYNPMVYREDAQIVHGKDFRTLKQLVLQRDGGFAQLLAPAANNLAGSRQGAWILPVATLDGCLMAVGVDLFILMGKRVEIPLGMSELRLNRLPQTGEKCLLRMRFRDSNAQGSTHDFLLEGADKTPILEVRGYQGQATSKRGEANLWERADNTFSELLDQ